MGEASVDLIIWLQANAPWLVPIAEAFTLLGDEDFYVLVFPLLYWSVSPRIGVRMGAMLLISAGLNSALKLAFATPRPFWVSDEVEAHVIEYSFGVPSGHAQNSVVVWGVLAHGVARSWAWIAAFTLMAAVGLSRWAVGVHAVEDTLVGWMVGIALLMAYVRLEPQVRSWIGRLSTLGQVVLAFAAPGVLITFALVVNTLRAGWELPAEWAANAAAADPDLVLDPMTVEGVFTPAGALCGLGLGLIWLHRTAGGFAPAVELWRRLVCYPLGLVGVVALWMGLGAVFPGGDEPLALALRFLRYALVGAWITGAAPLLFLRIRLVAPVHADGTSARDARA